jgi:hypothetical protein
MRLAQLRDIIKKLSDDIANAIERDVYAVGDKADLLKLFADTYKGNISS